MREFRILLIFLGILLFPSSLQAQICTLDMSIDACMGEVEQASIDNSGSRDSALSAATAEQAQALVQENTGPGSLVSQLLGGSINDFNPDFQILLNSVNFSDNAEQGIQIDWSGFAVDLLNNLGFNDGQYNSESDDHKLSIAINDPDIFSPLKERLDEAQLAEYQGWLEDTDDISFSLHWSPASQNRGRKISSHSGLFNTLFDEAFDRALITLDADDRVEEVLSYCQFDEDAREVRISTLLERAEQIGSQERRDACVTMVEGLPSLVSAAALAEANAFARLNQELTAVGFDTLRKLVSNQPQTVFSLNQTVRDELAGQDETSIKLSYEYGAFNANTLYRSCNNLDDIACVSNFLASNSTSIEAAARFSFSAQYVRKSEYSIELPGMTFLELEQEESLLASVSYGRNLKLIGNEPSRFELGVTYEDVSQDPMRNDRAIANLSLSQKLMGTPVTFGVVWANKPEYRGDVDKEISARLGINFKFDAN